MLSNKEVQMDAFKQAGTDGYFQTRRQLLPHVKQMATFKGMVALHRLKDSGMRSSAGELRLD